MTKYCLLTTVWCLASFHCSSTSAEPSSGSASASSTAVWTSAPPMLHARAAHAVVATSDAIYALAGIGDKNGGPDAFVWDANQSRDVFRWRRGIPTFRRSRGDAF